MSILREFYKSGTFGISFEVYPPKSAQGMDELFTNLEDLVHFDPLFITCTYGAGGSTRDKTLEIVERVKRQFGLPVAAHLTCVGADADMLRDYLREAASRGIDFIVALRGDPPKGETEFKPVENGLRYANELVSLIRREFASSFGIIVAGYPEIHQEAPNAAVDLDNLKRKVDAGADIVVTQLYYDNADFYRFRDRCAGAGISVPIVPGILPITNLGQIKRITALCGARLPQHLMSRLESHANDPQGQFAVGVYHATRQVEDLVEHGSVGAHFYVLNKSQATAHLLKSLTLPYKTAGQA
jgi:methylenetetrahydrofolate reductase (NADPH)